MPKLIIPQESAGSNMQPLSIQGTANQIASAAEIGKVQQTQGAAAIASGAVLGQQEQELGNFMAAQGNKYLGQAMKAMNETIYNIVQSNAVQDYNQQASNHVGKAVTPTRDVLDNYARANRYKVPGTLSKELDGISKEVTKKYSEAVQDPVVKERLAQNMDALNTNHKVMADSQERNAQIQMSNKAIEDGITTDIQSGLLDSPDNIGFYASQGLERIKSGLDAGIIDPTQAAAMGDKLRSGLYFGSLQVANQKDPNALAEALATMSSEELNLTPIEYQQLVKQNKFAMADVETLNQNQYKAQQEVAKTQSQLTQSSLMMGIKDGSVQSAQIVEMYDKGKISYTQYAELAKAYTSNTSKVKTTLDTRANVSAALDAGDVLSEFSPQQIDDHYTNRLRTLSPDGSTKVGINEKIMLAEQYKGPVPTFVRNLEMDVASGDPEKIKEAVYAYNKIQSSNPLVFSGVKDKKWTAYMSALTDSYKYTEGGLEPERIQSIKDSIYNVDGRTAKKRTNEFSTESKFSKDNIKETIAEMYEDGDTWLAGPDSVSDDVVNMLRPMLLDAYRTTGDASSALATVANQTKYLVGHTSVNDTERFGINSGSIMAAPPEKILAGKASAAEIRANINADLVGKLPEGISPDQVFVGSDDVTISQARNKQMPSYYLYYTDKNGDEILLPDRWKYDASSAASIEQSRVAKVEVNLPGATRTPTAIPSQQGKVVETPEQKLYAQKKAAIDSTLKTTKGYGANALMTPEFAAKVAAASYTSQIAAQYPGDAEARPAVKAAIDKMIGADKSSNRVGQTLKLVNSVLVNNADPKTYLKYGMSTNNPSTGDIVVGQQKAGLFNGVTMLNGKPMVQIIAMNDSKNITQELIPLDSVQGFRSMPTPEDFARQSKPLSAPSTVAPRFNPYTGEPARMGTGQEQLNIYDGTTTIKDPDAKPKKTLINPATGAMEEVGGTIKDQVADMVQAAPTKSTKGKATVAENATSKDTNMNVTPIDTKSVTGLEQQGNIDVSKQPIVQGNDGNVSTVHAITHEVNGKTVLIPNTIDGKVVTDAEAIEQFKQSGKHMGVFKNKSSAEKYLTKLKKSETDRVKKKGVKGKKVTLKDGSVDTIVQYENGQVRLRSGKMIPPDQIQSIDGGE